MCRVPPPGARGVMVSWRARGSTSDIGNEACCVAACALCTCCASCASVLIKRCVVVGAM
jgi:hypothetical protein